MAGDLQVLPQQSPDASQAVTFDFVSQLPPNSAGVVVESATVTVSVYAGVDPNPQALLIGTPLTAGTLVSATFGGGVAGTIYKLRILAHTSDTHTLARTAYLAVVEDPL